MKINKNRSWIHYRNKQRDSESDTDDKFKIIDILRRNFSLYGLTGEMVLLDGGRYRLPDIFIKKDRIVIELDGGIHGFGDDITKNESDYARDSDYHNNNYRLIVINKEITDGYQEEKVLKILKGYNL